MLGLLISLKAVGVISVKSKERVKLDVAPEELKVTTDDLSGYFVPTEWRANLIHVNQKQLAVDDFVCLENSFPQMVLKLVLDVTELLSLYPY